MTRKRIRNIIQKEWLETFADLNNFLFVTLLPLLIVAQGLLYIWLVDRFAGESALSSGYILKALEKLVMEIPVAATLSQVQQLQLLLLHQFKFYLLLIPTMIAISLATFTIVEEKQARNLEPLLATPVKTWELLLGKALAGAIPALIVTWICSLIFLVGVYVLGWGELQNLVLSPSWFMVLFLITPAIAVLSFLLGLIGSSQAKDAKNAQNWIVVVIIPVFALIGIQISGIIWFTAGLTLLLALALIIIDLLVLKVAVSVFHRESSF